MSQIERDTGESSLDFIMAYEGGEIEDEDEIVKGFQQLINSGLAWHYGRTAELLIERGLCRRHLNA